jgi:hypothetical protein
MSPHELMKLQTALQQKLESIQHAENALVIHLRERDEVREKLMDYYLTALVELNISAQEIECLLVERKLKGEEQ